MGDDKMEVFDTADCVISTSGLDHWVGFNSSALGTGSVFVCSYVTARNKCVISLSTSEPHSCVSHYAPAKGT